MYLLGVGLHIGSVHGTLDGMIAALRDFPEPDQSSARRIASKPSR